jgi:3-hydroxyacyl-[acyl-carrier-protein] dehydratase
MVVANTNEADKSKTAAGKGDGLRKATPLYDCVAILRLLPHRFPFLLVDRVEEITEPSGPQEGRVGRVGRKIRAIKNVTFNEPFFPGHFPHRPVMPGVLQVEAMAQVAAISVIDVSGPRMDVAIAGINEARFRRPVVPGDTLELTAEIIKDRGQIFVVKCTARVEGQVVSEVELIAKMFPLEEPRAEATK